MPDRYAEVAPELATGSLTYRVPESLGARLEPGGRLLVPVRGRAVAAYVLRELTESEALASLPPARRKRARGDLFTGPDRALFADALAVLDERSLLSGELIALGRFIAAEYVSSLGEALACLLPASVRRGAKPEKITYAEVTGPAEETERAAVSMERRSPKRAAILRALVSAGGRLERRELLDAAGTGAATLKALVKASRVREAHEAREGPAAHAFAPEPLKKISLTSEQAAAFENIRADLAGERPGVHVLYGVTGSGKTEVYLRLIREVVRGGRQAIVLVPEIALTPQTVSRFRARFDRIAVLHSHLTGGQRAAEWRRIASGEVDVVVGARSAVFAPLARLGLVVLDEEHETSFKQDSTPRYHARAVAVERARLAGAGVVLGSATPALESYTRALRREWHLHVLPTRVAERPLPPVEVLDLARESRDQKRYALLSRRLVLLVREALERKEQAILFLNRRGWATAIVCAECGFVARCTRCDVSLTYHRKRGEALCHHCGAAEPVGDRCPECGEPGLLLRGAGTERIEDVVGRVFPGVRVARLDSDAMKKRGAHANVLEDFRTGRTDILVGTQMIAKGLDFPRVTVVGIVNADIALDLPDFRASERTFQLVSQISGRAGRSELGGRVVVQTYHPHHPAVKAAAAHDYERFAVRELESRQEFGYPPFVRLARVVLRGKDETKVTRRAIDVASALREAVKGAGEAFDVLGPAPCPIGMIKELSRRHVLVKSREGKALPELLHRTAKALKSASGVHVAVDVDPVSML